MGLKIQKMLAPFSPGSQTLHRSEPNSLQGRGYQQVDPYEAIAMPQLLLQMEMELFGIKRSVHPMPLGYWMACEA